MKVKELKDKINQLAIVNSEKILDVSLFLNKQVDPFLMEAIGKDFYNQFKDLDYDVILTVESSGIAPAVFASLFAKKPLVIIKKEENKKDKAKYLYQESYSYTKNQSYFLTVLKDLVLNKKVILIDDFLAKGSVVVNVDKLLKQANSKLVGVGICISKNFQEGYNRLKQLDFRLYCQAEILELNTSENKVVFK